MPWYTSEPWYFCVDATHVAEKTDFQANSKSALRWGLAFYDDFQITPAGCPCCKAGSAQAFNFVCGSHLHPGVQASPTSTFTIICLTLDQQKVGRGRTVQWLDNYFKPWEISLSYVY